MMNESSNLNAVRQRAFLIASSSLGRAKGRHGSAPVHRSLSRMVVDPTRLMQALVLPAMFCLAILWAEPLLLECWRGGALYWAAQLALPLQAGAPGTQEAALGLSWLAAGDRLDMPGQAVWLGTAGLTVAALLASSTLRGGRLPLRYLMRILCFIQILSLVFFWCWPSQFPYSVADHLDDMAHVGFTLMLVTPIMLALGYYLLNVHAAIKILHTVLILLYFALAIPHQIVLHALILHHFSVLYMPILYICFGAVFDVLIFVALYSWAASTLPTGATV